MEDCNSCPWEAFTERRVRGGVSDEGETVVVVMMGGVAVVVVLLVNGGDGVDNVGQRNTKNKIVRSQQ